MFDFGPQQYLTLAIVVCLVNAFVMCLVAYRLMHVFQLSGYKIRNYLLWVGDRRSKFYIRLFALSILSLGAMLVVNIFFLQFEIIFLSFLGLIFYFFLSFMFIANVWNAKYKADLRMTSRVKRLYVLLYIVIFILTYTVLRIGWDNEVIRFALIALIPMSLPVVLIICNAILYPLEENIRLGFLSKAQRKLRRPEFESLIRIGITGSYGKTSCKNILARMLEKKYHVATSPASFNTPMGFSKTINNILEPEHEVIIMEMGARYEGDIRYLAKLFKPKYGILTSIGPQHLDTMGPIERVQRTKSELVHALPSDGIAILNGDNERCRQVFEGLEIEKYLSNLDTMATDKKITQDGCEFTLHIDGKFVQVKTRLLGRHNIENILMCAILAEKLGVEIEKIAEAISELEPTRHRLELTTTQAGVHVLDDSYNSSPDGVRASLEVLSLFKGMKIVMTPGLVELGAKQDEENFKFGVRIAEVADKVIVVNEINRTSILDGLKSQKFDDKSIFTVANLEEAKSVYAGLLKSGDVLLIQNDLPDNYV